MVELQRLLWPSAGSVGVVAGESCAWLLGQGISLLLSALSPLFLLLFSQLLAPLHDPPVTAVFSLLHRWSLSSYLLCVARFAAHGFKCHCSTVSAPRVGKLGEVPNGSGAERPSDMTRCINMHDLIILPSMRS